MFLVGGGAAMESAASKEAGKDLFSWSGFPAEWVRRLRQRFAQPLVPLELLDSPEGFEDDVLQGALLRGRLQEFREGLPHRKRIVQAQSNAVFKRPRLPTVGSDSAHMQEAYAISANALMPFKRKHGKSGLGKALLASEEDPDILETRERDRWVEVMSGFITEAQLPVVALIEGSEDRRQAWRRVFGTRRAKTLRNRARAFKRFRIWLETVRGPPVFQISRIFWKRVQRMAVVSVCLEICWLLSQCLSLWAAFLPGSVYQQMRLSRRWLVLLLRSFRAGPHHVGLQSCTQ